MIPPPGISIAQSGNIVIASRAAARVYSLPVPVFNKAMNTKARQEKRSAAVSGRRAIAHAKGYGAVMETPWPSLKLGIVAQDDAIVAIDFLPDTIAELDPSNTLAAEAVRQLRKYFREPRRTFNLPLAPQGTYFQQRVWQNLQRIPAGATSSYIALARRIRSGARAVGGACRANPIPIVIPCHRVVAVNGMGGFMGDRQGHALRIKQYLLDHESSA